MKTLVCIADGGLGNCVSHFLYCIYLAQKYDLQLVVIKLQSCNCLFDFSKHFILPKDVKYINIDMKVRYKNLNNDQKLEYVKKMNTILEEYNIDTYVFHNKRINGLFEICKNMNKVHQKDITQTFFKDKNIVYFNDYYLNRKTDEEDFKEYIVKSKLNITNSIRNEINKFDIDDSYVGIHYRATDCPQRVPINDYIAQLEKKIDPNQKVFICSDEESGENTLRILFKNSISLPKTSYVKKHHLRAEGIFRDAESCTYGFIDCILLGKTRIHPDGIKSTFRCLGKMCNYLFM